jgi:uncharacterized membrane-anchored protein
MAAETDFNKKILNRRLIIRAILSMTILSIFCVLLILIFYVELPTSMETMSATLLGALVGNLTTTLSYWFDSTENDNHERTMNGQAKGGNEVI